MTRGVGDVQPRRVGVIGAGVMGAGIAQAFAQGGDDVVCQDLADEQLARARADLWSGKYGLDAAVAGGHLDRAAATAAADRIVWTTDVDALGDCDLVVECVPEDPAIKRQVLADLAERVSPDAIIATNTSGLPVASLQDAVAHPERFLAWHWASPAQVSRFAEVVPHEGTSPAVVEEVCAIARALGRNPVVVRDDPTAWGFVANRLYGAMLVEAARVVDAGLCAREDVDRLMVDAFGWPAGPFGMVRGAATGWTDPA